MTGYTKLFGSIVASTIWREDDKTRIVWITMLALSNKDGIVEASIPGLADLSRVTVNECRRAVTKLEAPDPDSRTKAEQGRRIVPIDGGWRLVNHAKYRAKMGEAERREYLRLKQQEHRSKKAVSTVVNNCQQTSTPSTHTEADSDADTEAKKKTGSFSPASQKLQGASLVVAQKEFDRIITRVKEIRNSYDSHNEMSSEHRKELKSLSLRKSELKSQLGVAI